VGSGDVNVRRDELRQEEDEISIIEVASFVVRRRLFIVLPAILGVLLTIPAVLTTTFEYTATASFLPNGGGQGGLVGAAGLAAQFGFSMPRSGSSERSPEFYQALLESREILDGLVRDGVRVVTPTQDTTVNLSEHFGIEGGTAAERGELTRRHLGVVVEVSIGRETGIVSLRVRTDDAALSAAIAWALLDLISAFDLETRQSEASAERIFAEERLQQLQVELATVEDSLRAFLDENRQFGNSSQLTFQHDRLQRKVGMRQEVVTAMAQAYEQARIDEVRNTPLVTVIDEPEVPALPEPRGRLLKLLSGALLGTVMGFGIALVVEYGERARSEKNEEYGELRRLLRDAWADFFDLRRSRRPPPVTEDSEV
jgi:uncharacterized protein involved in exopolysaccharide biosynthesis